MANSGDRAKMSSPVSTSLALGSFSPPWLVASLYFIFQPIFLLCLLLLLACLPAPASSMATNLQMVTTELQQLQLISKFTWEYIAAEEDGLYGIIPHWRPLPPWSLPFSNLALLRLHSIFQPGAGNPCFFPYLSSHLPITLSTRLFISLLLVWSHFHSYQYYEVQR